MSSNAFCANKLGCTIIALVALFVGSSLQARESGKLELWFEYDGRPLIPGVAPDVHCYNQNSMSLVGCDLYRSEDGRYWIEQPPPGKYLLRVSVDENRGNAPLQSGDLYREVPLYVDKATTGPLLVSLHKLIALQKPVDSHIAVSEISADCENKTHYRTKLLALSSGASLDFAWEPYGNDVQYHYKIWSIRCSDGARIERLFLRKTHDSAVRITVPPNEPGEYYRFEVSAVRNAQIISQLSLFDGQGEYFDAYPFIVNDPLGDRSWLLYLFATVVLLLLLFVGLLLLRAIFRLPVAPADHGTGRLAWLFLVLLALGVSGFMQRQILLEWLVTAEEEASASLGFMRKWYQVDKDETGNGKGTAPAVMRYVPGPDNVLIPEGTWQGVVVSTTGTPFIGDDRRAELRITFDKHGGLVQWLDSDRWTSLSNDAFSIKPAGAGLNLFGHWRHGSESELWTINIPELGGDSFQISMDRLLSRRDAIGKVISTVRYQASGELQSLHP